MHSPEPGAWVETGSSPELGCRRRGRGFRAKDVNFPVRPSAFVRRLRSRTQVIHQRDGATWLDQRRPLDITNSRSNRSRLARHRALACAMPGTSTQLRGKPANISNQRNMPPPRDEIEWRQVAMRVAGVRIRFATAAQPDARAASLTRLAAPNPRVDDSPRPIARRRHSQCTILSCGWWSEIEDMNRTPPSGRTIRSAIWASVDSANPGQPRFSPSPSPSPNPSSDRCLPRWRQRLSRCRKDDRQHTSKSKAGGAHSRIHSSTTDETIWPGSEGSDGPPLQMPSLRFRLSNMTSRMTRGSEF